MKIIHVRENSLGEMIGLKTGDRLLKINGKRVIDEIDYRFRITDESMILDLEIDGKMRYITNNIFSSCCRNINCSFSSIYNSFFCHII